MLSRLSATLVALLLALTAQSDAQTTWIVDRANGPGAHFTEIQPALDAAADGDEVIVRGGSYYDPPVHVSKGLTLRGQGNFGHLPDIRIENLPSDRRFHLLDFTGSDEHRVRVAWCAGDVIIENVNLRASEIVGSSNTIVSRCSGYNFGWRNNRIDVTGGSFVQFLDCGATYAGFSVSVTNSTVVIARSILEGNDASYITMCFATLEGWPAEPALRLLGSSRAIVLDSTLTGGDEGIDCLQSFPSEFAVRVTSPSQLVECRTNLTLGGPSTRTSIAASPSAVVTDDTLVSLSLGGGRSPGATAQFRTRSTAGATVRVYVGNDPALVALPTHVPLLIQPTRGASFGQVATGGDQVISFQIPALPVGTTLYAQASRTLPGGSTELSNSVALVVR